MPERQHRSPRPRSEKLGSERLDTACNAWGSPDQSLLFQRQQHLVDGWRADPEEALQVGLRRGASEHHRIGMDKGEILPLFGREARVRGAKTPGTLCKVR